MELMRKADNSAIAETLIDPNRGNTLMRAEHTQIKLFSRFRRPPPSMGAREPEMSGFSLLACLSAHLLLAGGLSRPQYKTHAASYF